MNKLIHDLTNEQTLWGVLVGAYIVTDSWKLYLIFRNTLMLRNMPDAPPELDISPALYERMKLTTQHESERILLTTVSKLYVKIAKLVFNYFPRIWTLTADYGLGKSLVKRCMWFAVVDNCNEFALTIPFVFMSTLLTGIQNPWYAVLVHTYDMAYCSLLSAFVMYGAIYVTDNFGVSSILKGHLVLNALGVIFIAFYYKFMITLDHEPLPDDEIGKSVRALANQVGYPADTIYIDKRSDEPNAYYSNAIFSKTIIITESLLASLDAPQATSVVAHELGHWANHHVLYIYLGHTLEIIANGYFWILAYGSSSLIRVFQLDPDIHPVIPVYISFYLIWPPIRDIFNGTFNFIKTYFEFVADDYACMVCAPTNLRQALVKVSLKMKGIPLLDNWFSAWFIGHPPVLQRIQRIDGHLETK